MKTKLFLFIFAFFTSTTIFAHDFVVNGLYYNLLGGDSVEVTFQGNTANRYNEYLGNIIIPPVVEYNNMIYRIVTIGGYAFQYSSVESIFIPYSVLNIGFSAFSGCKSLTTVTLPEDLTYIGDYAFSSCSQLTEITIPNSVTAIGGYAFRFCDSLTKPLYNQQIFAFMPTSYMDSYEIPNGITEIIAGAFYNCSHLNEIIIPNTITMIGANAFYGCTNLTEISIPNSVITISWKAFEKCTNLTTISLSENVTTIGDDAFLDCSNVQKITCLAPTPPTILSNTFKEVSRSIPLYVPAQSINVYKGALYWSKFTNIQAIPTVPDILTEHSSFCLKEQSATYKILENGTIFIIHNGDKYMLNGQLVK